MSLPVACPGCRATLMLGEALRGKPIRCSGCQKVFLFDQPSAPPPFLPVPVSDWEKSFALVKDFVRARPWILIAGGMAGVLMVLLLIGVVRLVLPDRPADPPAPIVKAPPEEPPRPRDPPEVKPPPEKKPDGPPPEKPLSGADLAQKMKAASALVINRKPNDNGYARAYGAAFCIHPSGIFFTSRAAGGPQGHEVTLVRNPGTKEQKVVPARLLRTARECALLKVDSVGDLPFLEVGTMDKLAELTEVFAYGFRPNTLTQVNNGQYLEGVIGPGKVTALRHKGPFLDLVQLDVSISVEDSVGGVVVDNQGRVRGMVISGGPRGSRVVDALPMVRMREILMQPLITLRKPVPTPPPSSPITFSRDKMDQPHLFEAHALALLPEAKITGMELVLYYCQQKPRKYPMEQVGNLFRVQAPPALIHEANSVSLGGQVIYRPGHPPQRVSFVDFPVKVGTREVRLRQIQTLIIKPAGKVTLHDGSVLEGEISGLDPARFKVLGPNQPLNLTQFEKIELPRAPALDQINYYFQVWQDGQPAGTESGTFHLVGPEPKP